MINGDNQLPYAELASVKAYLNLSASDTSKDAMLNLLITNVQAFIDKYTGRTFGWGNPDNEPQSELGGSNSLSTADLQYYAVVNNEMYDGTVGKTIWLRHTDIVNIDAVKIGQRNIGNQQTLDTTQYVWRDDGRIILGGSYFNSYNSTIYTDTNDNEFYGTVAAGYQTLSISYHYGVYGVPSDIALAALDIIAAMYALRQAAGLQMERVGDYQVQYDVNFRQALTLQPDSLDILNKWRFRRVA